MAHFQWRNFLELWTSQWLNEIWNIIAPIVFIPFAFGSYHLCDVFKWFNEIWNINAQIVFTSFAFPGKCIRSRPTLPLRYLNSQFNWYHLPQTPAPNEEKWPDLKQCIALLCPNFVPPSKLTSINNLDIGRTLSSQSQDYISKYEIFLRKYFHRPERNPFQEIKWNIVQNWRPCCICNSFQASVLLVILSAAHTSYLFLFPTDGPSL